VLYNNDMTQDNKDTHNSGNSQKDHATRSHNRPPAINETNPVWTAEHLKPLTKKQRAFVEHIANNPKASATQAVKATYGREDKPVTELSARNIASENLTKPNIKHALAQYENTAEYNLITLANKSTEYAMQGGKDGASYAAVSERVNNSILDRLRGKAKQQIDVTSKSVIITVDLTGVTDTGAQENK
jgi:hypothetical protein